MRTYILASLISGFLCWNASAQTADDWVSQGRSSLAARDITDANASFAQALTLNPNHKNANALYAITRLLVLPSQPAGSNFLTRIGFPIAGRNIYSWSSTLPKDANGLWIAPNGVNANEFTFQLRTNVLPAVSGAIGNLAAITDTNFTISLTGSETAIAGVTVDYGDLKLIQAGLYASEYFIYTLNAQNLDAQLTAIRALYTNGALSAGQVLSDYPQLFNFSTTNDLWAAQAAFTNAVNCYFTASAFIRSRPPGEIRLFNDDKMSAQREADFRSVLTDLENSLAGARVLSVKTNLTVDMANGFSGISTWRGLLPQFQKNAIVLGTFPDLTFGGVIGGLTRDEVESFVGEHFTMLPFGRVPSLSATNTTLVFATLKTHYYALEASTNLLDWQVVANFTATNAVSTLIDMPVMSKRFYRLRDNTGFLAFSGVVQDQNTGLPIFGAQVLSLWDGSRTFTDTNGQFFLSTLLSTPGLDYLGISASSYTTTYKYYYGLGLVSGLQIYLSQPPPINILSLNNPLNNLSGLSASQTFYKVAMPAGHSSLQISISGGTGDCDLYIKYGSQPTLSSWDYRPYLSGNNETVNISNPTAGDWYIMLQGYDSYSGVTLLAR